MELFQPFEQIGDFAIKGLGNLKNFTGGGLLFPPLNGTDEVMMAIGYFRKLLL